MDESAEAEVPQAQAGADRDAATGARAFALAKPLVWLDLEMTGAVPCWLLLQAESFLVGNLVGQRGYEVGVVQ